MDGFEAQMMDTPVESGVMDSPEVQPELNQDGYTDEITETPEATEQQPSEPSEQEEAPQADAKPMLPAQLTKAIRELKEAHPDHAQALKELQSAYYKGDRYAKIFPSAEEALEAKSMLDAIGGKQGMVDFQKQRDLIQEYDRQVDEGDPEIIKWMAQASPDGFKKLVPTALQTLQRIDYESYEEILQPILLETLESSGVSRAISSALQELKAGETARASSIIQQLQDWTERHRQIAQQRANRYQDPRLQQLESRERNLSEQTRQMVESHVDRDIDFYLQSKVPETIKKIAGASKLSQQAREDLMSGILAEIDRVMGADEFYNSSKASMIRQALPSGNIDPVVRFAKAQIEKILDRSANSVWNRRYGSMESSRSNASRGPSPIQPRNGSPRVDSQPQAQRPVLVSRRPDANQFDTSRTTQEMFLNGKGYLKNGQFVTWKRS